MSELAQALADLVDARLGQRLDRIEASMAYRPAWIKGWVNLARYLGHDDKKGRTARAWAEAENLPRKMINGVPHFSIKDVDRAMRNGRAVETRVKAAPTRLQEGAA